MPKLHDTWKALPHKPIEKLNDRLWRVQGTLPDMPLRRVMSIARREDGSLVIHNAIALQEEAMRELEAWGTPRYLIVPNGYHRLDAPAFKQRYPGLVVLCPQGATKAVSRAVAVDGNYETLPEDAHVSLTTLAGVGAAEGIMTVRDRGDVTLVFNDLIFNMPHGKGIMGAFFRYVTASTGGPRISRIVRLFVAKDKRALRKQLEQLAETEGLKRIIVSHHRVIEEHPAETLRSIAATLS